MVEKAVVSSVGEYPITQAHFNSIQFNGLYVCVEAGGRFLWCRRVRRTIEQRFAIKFGFKLRKSASKTLEAGL